jgi:hypothetical protein
MDFQPGGAPSKRLAPTTMRVVDFAGRTDDKTPAKRRKSAAGDIDTLASGRQ